MQNPMPVACSVEGCSDPRRGQRDLCNKHRIRLQRHGRLHARVIQSELPCIIEGCEFPRHVKGLCSKHFTRLQTHGTTDSTVPYEKHGMSKTHPLYETWQNIKSRCYRPSCEVYSYYGGRGIRMCDQWRHSFSSFLADVGERPAGHTLDRIDNAGNYEPGNVRWASMSTQSKNTRTRRDNASGHRGVCWDNSKNRWRAFNGGGKARVELGYFTDFDEALDARHRATIADPDFHCCAELEAMRKGTAA